MKHERNASGRGASLAYRRLRVSILRGEISLGQVLSTEEIAAQIGLRVSSVSDACVRLTREGLLDTPGNGLARVRWPTREEVVGHFAVREALEVQAASLFASSATPEFRIEVRALAAEVDVLARRQAHADYLSLHHRLHRKIAVATGYRSLSRAIDTTNALVTAWMAGVKLPIEECANHQELADVLASESAARAASLMRAHIGSGNRKVMDGLEAHFVR